MNEPLFPRTLSEEWNIPFLAGRPERGHRIDEDDLVNLKIALGLHHDVLDVCADPHLFTRDAR